MQITYCPPVEPHLHLHFDKVQFVRSAQAVGAHYVGIRNASVSNGWESTGLSFGDYANMRTQKRKGKGAGDRRLETPAFMLDERRFRSVIIRFLEVRAGLQKRQVGTEVERMQRVSAGLKKRAEAAIAIMDKFCAMYVAATDDAERKQLQRRIAEYDSAVRLYREPWCIPQMCRAYYFERLDSVGVASRLGFKSPHVRQILYRLARLDAEMQAGTDAPQKQPVCQTYHGKEGNKQMTEAERANYAAHVRWHVKRGSVNPNCELCRAKEKPPRGDKPQGSQSYFTC